MEAMPAIHQTPHRAEVIRLLQSAALPKAGIQFYGADALLRSLVVTAAHRTQGLGHRLVERGEHHARERGATTVYLLTTTAESFFRSRGYVVTPRDGAPPAIRSTPEFAALCPANSAFLSKHL